VSDSGAQADFASSSISDGTAFGKTQVITRTANADCIDDGSVLLQTSKASVIPQRLSKETTDPSQEWTQEKNDLLRHLRSTAGLSWARIALYFPHNSKSELRCKFAARVATTVEQEKNIHLLKRKRGRSRKCEHPPSRTEQRRQSQARADRSQPFATRPYDRTPLPLPLIPQLTVIYSVSSSSNGPSVAKGRGRKRKVSAASELETKRFSNTPVWTVDRIVGIVDVGGKQHYRVRWEETLEPVENLQGCANTAIAEYHLRHLR